MSRQNNWELLAPGDSKFLTTGRHDLFGSERWGHVLAGLGCQVLYAYSREAQVARAVPVFRRWGLKAAFLGFPVAGEAFDACSEGQFAAHLAGLARAVGADVVRGTRSCQVRQGAGVYLPEVWTDDLAAWPGALARRIDRDVAFARRACEGRYEIVQTDPEPARWHAMYAATVSAHRGVSRYTGDYFRRLAEVAGPTGPLRVFQARTGDGVIHGFAVLALDGGSGYYLHGAVDHSARSFGLSDLLLRSIIDTCRAERCFRFTLMASPPAQSGLVRFKKKWAECTGWSITTDVAGSLAGRLALAAQRLVPGPAARIVGASDRGPEGS